MGPIPPEILHELDRVCPISAVLPYTGATAPAQWLLCDGSAISRTTYAGLFGIIGTAFGVGDGSTTFNIPDLRNSHLRGVGTSTIFTQDGTITLAQVINDALQGHYHIAGYWADGSALYFRQTPAYTYPLVSQYGAGGGGSYVSHPMTDGSNGTPRTANETKVNAVGVNFIIKY